MVGLVPAHVGLTAEPNPTIAWWVGDGVSGDLHFQVVLIDEGSIDPLVDQRLATPRSGGIQLVRLADFG